MKQPQHMMGKIVSELAMTHALLNCLVKEFALPEKRVQHVWPEQVAGLQPQSCLQGIHLQARPFLIALPPNREIFVLVDRYSSLGSQRYLSDVYVRQVGKSWQVLEFSALAKFILESCATVMGAYNQELFEQMISSQKLVGQILNHQQDVAQRPAFSSYIASEQSLWFGHPSHPAPKARMWPDDVMPQQVVTPEFQAQVPLHCFAVPIDGLHIRTNNLSFNTALTAVAPQISSDRDFAQIAMHPVQAKLFMLDARVQSLLEKGVIQDKGLCGHLAHPTASIRTWFIEQGDYFIKGSLHVRITNCVRKNAWYELESALIVDELFAGLESLDPALFAKTLIAREPASLCWSPKDASREDQDWFREQTGIVLRENFCKQHPSDSFLLAATAFARDSHLQPMIWQLVGHDSTEDVRLAWFDRYQQILLEPILRLFFDYGVVMEPHLQNTVFSHKNGMPERIVLRDFEGVKLTEDVGIASLQACREGKLSERVQASLTYSREKGWQRIAYCLFINNLSEVVLALSWDKPSLAEKMWRSVRHTLTAIEKSLTRPAPELVDLLERGDIACKCNLKVRLAANADKQADYVQLKAPWVKEVACA